MYYIEEYQLKRFKLLHANAREKEARVERVKEEEGEAREAAAAAVVVVETWHAGESRK